jgi:hypothetical protein
VRGAYYTVLRDRLGGVVGKGLSGKDMYCRVEWRLE